MKSKISSIEITPSLTKEQWLFLCDKWDRETDIILDTSLINIMEEIEHVAKIAFLIKERKLSLAVLSNLAEKDKVSNELLNMIFDIGDQSCKETVCLRKDLSEELMVKCKSASLVHHQ